MGPPFFYDLPSRIFVNVNCITVDKKSLDE